MTALATAAVDAVFAAFGRPATYAPDMGTPQPCTVLLNEADETPSFGDTRLIVGGHVVEVRKSEVMPEEGGTFQVGSQTLKILGEPRSDDPERLVWTCGCK